MIKKNLLLIPDVEHHDIADFERISSLIQQRAADIQPLVMSWAGWRGAWLQRLRLASRPTLVVGMRSFGKAFSPWRGVSHQGQNLAKSETYRRMQEAGVPTLPWCPWTADTELAEWMGSFVISKPDKGARGRSVKIRAVSKLRFDPERHNKEPLILQQFIYTGAFPVVHRVLTLYGEPIMHYRSENKQAQACTDPNDKQQISGHNPVASNRGAEITLSEERDIEGLASTVAKSAFGDIPLLGFDIIRSAVDGALHICEVNTYGHTWHFSSEIGKPMQNTNGLDFYGQKNVFDTAADVLIAACREHAR